MIQLAKRFKLLEAPGPRLLHEHHDNKVTAFERAGLVFVFNFHSVRSYNGYFVEAPPSKYRMILDSDARKYGGHGRLEKDQFHFTVPVQSGNKRQNLLSLYLPTRTALVLRSADEPNS
jgi:1,4-alpha-glucan branching enzyme